ncbi:MAG: ECF-type sigma factor [Gemmatimonadetes bacterium]|nr:ECF-type sigma factor [Gemmatimonadota bacterium]
MSEPEPRTPEGESPPAVTELLLQYRNGQPDALDRVFPLIYDELHRIAHAQLEREPEGHTLNTTALVHEAYIRLVDITRVEWRDRVHFLSMAARAMRRILIDYARRHKRARRGGGVRPVTLDEALVAADHQADTLLALDLALEQLASLNQRLVRVVECRFFGGLTEDETAEALQVNARTVRRDWVKARGWLQQAMASTPI